MSFYDKPVIVLGEDIGGGIGYCTRSIRQEVIPQETLLDCAKLSKGIETNWCSHDMLLINLQSGGCKGKTER